MNSPRALAILVVVLSLLAAAGVTRLSSSSHYSVYLDDEDPALVAHERIQAEFGRGESLLVLLEAEDRDFLTPELWFLLEDLADALRQAPNVNAVIAASELGIGGVVETASGQLIPDRDAIGEHGRVFGLLLSDDARLAALLVDVNLPDYDAATVLGINDRIRTLVDQYTEDYSVAASYTGTQAMGGVYVEVVRSDLRVIMPLLLVTMFVLLAGLLGGLRTVLATLPLGLLAVASAFGIAGWASAELAAINTFAPIMILSISLAGCVHLVLAFQRLRRDGAVPGEAARFARQQVMLPMTIANGTTILGFLALLLSPSPPLRVVGYTVAAGIAVSWVACVVLLPGLLARFDPRVSRAQSLSVLLKGLAASAVRRRRSVLVATLGLAVVSSVLVSRNSVSDSVLDYFPSSHPFSAATHKTEKQLAGVNEVIYSINAGSAEALLDATTIRAIDGFVDWLREQPEVRRVSSLLDTDLIRSAIESDRLQERLDVFARRGVSGIELRELTRDRSGILVSVYVDRLDSRGIVDLDDRIRDAAIRLLPQFDISSGGASLIFARLGENNIRSMLLALSLGLLLAAVLFGLILRSLTVAVVGLACNVLPVLAVYGLWAVFEGTISLGAATVMGMILGIVIDDTVYLLTAWWRERRYADAAVRAVADVGPALVTTTIVLAAGLAAGLLSDFMPVWSMSALSVGIIVAALIIDLVALPAMLQLVKDRA